MNYNRTELLNLQHSRGHGLLEVQSRSRGYGSEKIENHWSKISVWKKHFTVAYVLRRGEVQQMS